MALTDHKTLVSDLVRDDANAISDPQIDTAIAGAIARYSKDRPRKKVEDITSAGGQSLDLPEGWQPDFSDLLSMEYPLGSVPPSMLENDSYQLYMSPDGQIIQLANGLAVNAVVRSTYTILHQVDDATDTIPLTDREAVCCLAAASLCDQLANRYSGDTDSTIQADNVNHQTKAGEFASRARALRKRYTDELGIDPKRNVSAGTVVTLKNKGSGGRPRLTHNGSSVL